MHRRAFFVYGSDTPKGGPGEYPPAVFGDFLLQESHPPEARVNKENIKEIPSDVAEPNEPRTDLSA